MLALKIFGGLPTLFAKCTTALARLCQSLARVKISVATGRNIEFVEKSRLGWVQTHMYYFVGSGPKFTRPLSANAGRIVLGHISFRFWIGLPWLVPEIFAIKVGSCAKSTQNLAGGGQFLERIPPNFWTCIKKMTHILITVQSFAAIGERSSEILCFWLKNITTKTEGLLGGLKTQLYYRYSTSTSGSSDLCLPSHGMGVQLPVI